MYGTWKRVDLGWMGWFAVFLSDSHFYDMKYTTTTTVAYGVPFLGYVILFYGDPSFHGKRSILVFRY